MSSCSNSECTCAEVIDSAERRQSPPGGPNLIEGIEDLLRPRAHRDVLRKIDPANYAVGINQKFGRPGNVRAFRSCAGMQHIVTANNFCLGIGKQRETVAEFLRLPPIDLRRINADTDYTDPARIEIRKPVLKTPQLGVAERSPKAAIKNQHDSF